MCGRTGPHCGPPASPVRAAGTRVPGLVRRTSPCRSERHRSTSARRRSTRRACGATGPAHLAAERYQLSEKAEYVVDAQRGRHLRRVALFKYRFTGRDAERFLAGVMARDSAHAQAGRGPLHAAGATTAASWSRTASSSGTAPDEFMLTARRAQPRLLRGPVRPRDDVAIEDVSRRLGGARRSRARARASCSRRSVPSDRPRCRTSATARRASAGTRSACSRTGYTRRPRLRGLVPRRATRSTCWDAVWAATRGHGVVAVRPRRRCTWRASRPACCCWTWTSTRAGYAWTDARPRHAHRAGPRLDAPRRGRATERAFIGRDALRRELARRHVPLSARRGLVVDYADWNRVHDEAGPRPADGPPPRPGGAVPLRRRRRPGRLLHELHVLAGPPAPHRHRPRAGSRWRRRAVA